MRQSQFESMLEDHEKRMRAVEKSVIEIFELFETIPIEKLKESLKPDRKVGDVKVPSSQKESVSANKETNTKVATKIASSLSEDTNAPQDKPIKTQVNEDLEKEKGGEKHE